MKYVLGSLAVFLLLLFAILFIVNQPINNNEVNLQDDVFRLSENIDTPATRVALEVRGEVNGVEEHRSIRIIVSRTERKAEVLSGYDGDVIRASTYRNTEAAYETFLSALDKAGFSNVQRARYEDKRGVCPFGNVYTYQFIEGQEERVDLWGSTCSSKDGTFDGDDGLVRRLFRSQIPNYSEFKDDVRL